MTAFTLQRPPYTAGLSRLFDLDPDGWAPRKALYRLAVAGGYPYSDRAFFELLRRRGFRESTRRGVAGFHGFRVSPALAAAPRLVPQHSAASYRRGDRSREAREARRLQRQVAELYRDDPLPEPPAFLQPGELWNDELTQCQRHNRSSDVTRCHPDAPSERDACWYFWTERPWDLEARALAL
ncbi:hypothetical protein [Microcella alkalica]|uniref:hypothetical protein n=1 Tax=Microcella alkalica TaxID=355930 RepID=UPI00145D5741|nr:hypothetical protein [Microcella alkalica]